MTYERSTITNSLSNLDPNTGDLLDPLTGVKIGICLQKEQELLDDIKSLLEKNDEYYNLLIQHGIIEKPVTVEDLQAKISDMAEQNRIEREKDREENRKLQDLLTQLLGGMQNDSTGNVQNTGSKSKGSRRSTKTDDAIGSESE